MGQYINDFTENTQQYFKEIKGFKAFNKIEEQSLFKRIKRNDQQARDLVITHNLKFVVSVAKRYTGRGLSMGELISEGNTGLIKAIDRFDASQDIKFISYAVWWIKQAMQEAIRKNNLMQKDELPEEYEKYDEDTLDENDKPIKNSFIIEDTTTDVDKKTLLIELLACLTEREVDMLSQYFGLIDGEEKTLDEIGEQYSITKERVRQINATSLKKLRAKTLEMNLFDDVFASIYIQ
jgi:RNA polymerase primary sigma factor